MISELRNLGFDVLQTNILLRNNNNYSLKDIVRTVRDLGYPLKDLSRIGGHAQAIGPVMYELGYTINDTALIMTLMNTPKSGRLIVYLYEAGWRNPADIAQASIYVGMPRLQLFREMRKVALTDLGLKNVWTPPALGRAIADGTDLTMIELSQSVIKAYEMKGGIVLRMDMFTAIEGVKDYAIEGLRKETGGAAGDVLGILTSMGDSVVFMALHDGGLHEKEAARIMKQKGWDWIATTIQLEQAGYSSGEIWDALWDIYHNEMGLLILNAMSFAMPLAELGLAPQLSMIESAAKTAFTKSITYAVMH
ncbi:hypothetical protein WMW72_13985 [Paenibacillus filicis]|uniref:Uncharacterized protein n=1 Tax=Paenibacillus filicis TaxID=669464 RepID=A0ABU9DJG6_9BACL